ncbi:MAG: hypothetical protein AAF989_12680, partial [Planctomycetota bacterium]
MENSLDENVRSMSDASEDGSPLNEWKPSHESGRVRRQWVYFVVVGMTLSAAIASFMVMVFRPMHSNELRVLCITPGESAQNVQASTGTNFASSGEHRTSGQRRTSGQHRTRVKTIAFHEFAQTLPTVKTETSLTIAAATGSGFADWVKTHSSNRPLLIHLTGAAVMDHERAFIVPHRDSTSARPESIDVGSMIRELAIDDVPKILVVDAFDERKRSIDRLPEITAWQFNRVVDETIGRLSRANLMVVVSHGRVRPRSEDRLTPMTKRMLTAFGKRSDENHDQVVSGEEWLSSVVSMDDEAPQDVVRWFCSRDVSQWRDVELAPVLGVTADDGADMVAEPESPPRLAESSRGDSKDEAPSPPKTPLSAKLSVTAPTLPIAIGLTDSGIESKHAVHAAQVNRELLAILNVEASASEAQAWLETPVVADARWDEIEWMRKVVKLNLSWRLRQDLIRLRAQTNQLALDPLVRRIMAQRWHSLQWTRLDAERNATSPVRADVEEFVAQRVKHALSMADELQTDSATMHHATRRTRDVRVELDGWLSRPVVARNPADDVVCQLLQSCVVIEDWLR